MRLASGACLWAASFLIEVQGSGPCRPQTGEALFNIFVLNHTDTWKDGNADPSDATHME